MPGLIKLRYEQLRKNGQLSDWDGIGEEKGDEDDEDA